MFGLGAMSMLVSLTFWGILGRVRHHSRRGTNISGGDANDTIINITTPPNNENRRK